ncbi:hypothetical protein [Thalassotalea sp. G2M2-11]|uniref:hypothetical protein n=1 Tax=Thalassotalea sp. G2M2-11 TaxID=2787627 RepID=UPI0019CFD810|nr:hypothetical protein [Thalassotalea sp. G2M2-11]
MRKIFTGLLLALVVKVSLAADTFPEPFGLTWEMSEAGLKKIGFAQISDSEGLKVFSSLSVPKAWSKAENYIVVTYKGKLVKAVAVSKKFTDDIYGSEGKSVYKQVKNLLAKKYGSPSEQYETVGRKLYDDSDEFYQCLEYSGCGVYLSFFNFAGGMISVQLNGKQRGVGYLTIGYESPYFSIAKKEIERGNIESDADAF